MKTKLIPACLLCVAALVQGATYYGAETFTNEAYRFGRFEARMWMAAGSGTVSSMFLYYNNSYLGSPEPWREIDIEILGKNPSSFQSNLITGNLAKKTTSEQVHAVTPATNAAYHDYAIEWTPDYIAWFVDGIEMRRSTGQQVTDLQDQDQNLRFNLWASTSASWVGAWSDTILPIQQYISWVRVSSYTPGTGPNGSNFTQLWQDDFDSFDDSRWGTGNWTFSGNRVTFDPGNVTATSGAMVLSMSKDAPANFTGTVPFDNGITAIHKVTSPMLNFQMNIVGENLVLQLPASFREDVSIQVQDIAGRQFTVAPTMQATSSLTRQVNLSKLPKGVLLASVWSKGQLVGQCKIVH